MHLNAPPTPDTGQVANRRALVATFAAVTLGACGGAGDPPAPKASTSTYAGRAGNAGTVCVTEAPAGNGNCHMPTTTTTTESSTVGRAGPGTPPTTSKDRR